jgi:hypothetical protein
VSEHLSQPQIERYRQRRLKPPELLAIDDHLAGCADCRRLLREVKPVEEAISALRSNLQTIPVAAPGHLTRAQLRSYAASQLDEIGRELIESHLEFCQQCSARAARRPSPSSWRDWLVPQFGWAAFFTRPRGAAAILATALLALTGALVWRMSNVPAPAVDNKAAASVAEGPAISRSPQGEPTPGQALLSLNDGGRQVTLLANGRLTGLDELQTEYQQLAATALTKGQVELPAGLSELRSAAGVMMGGGQQTTTEKSAQSGLIPGVIRPAETRAAPLAETRVPPEAETRLSQAEANAQRLSGQLEELAAISNAARGGAKAAQDTADGEKKFKLIEPAGKIIFSVRPTLRWQALDGAESYVVTVIDPKNNFDEVAKSPPLTQEHWKVDRALRRGRTYIWQVTAAKNGAQITAPAPEAGDVKFKVLDQAQADEIDRATKTYAGEHLIPGLLYARAGLLDEAVRELKALSAANPQAKEVKNLLKDLRAKQRAR